MKECGKRNSHLSSKLHMICISSNNDGHPVIKTFTPLNYTLASYTSLHFTPLHYPTRHFISSQLNFTQLHFTTLHYLLIWLNLTWKLLTGMDLQEEDLYWSRSWAGFFLEGLEKKNTEPAKFRAGHLPNVCLEHYITNTPCIACACNDDLSITSKFPTV